MFVIFEIINQPNKLSNNFFLLSIMGSKNNISNKHLCTYIVTK